MKNYSFRYSLCDSRYAVAACMCVCLSVVNKFNISFDVIKGVGFINIYLNHDLNGQNDIVLAFLLTSLTHEKQMDL